MPRPPSAPRNRNISAGPVKVEGFPATGFRLVSDSSFSATTAAGSLFTSISAQSSSGPYKNANRRGLSRKHSVRSENGMAISSVSPPAQRRDSTA